MKIIVSHDVDHLYPGDHLFKDLFFLKLWFHSFTALINKRISLKTFIWRLSVILSKRLTRIPEMIEVDKQFNIPSTFFFGMDKCKGMNYNKENAKIWIRYVIDNGFDAGVHGVDIENQFNIRAEYDSFKNVSNLSSFGIRIHYLRNNENLLRKLEQTGYLFDSSTYNRSKLDMKQPYRIGKMWEFPLHIMDSDILKNKLLIAEEITVSALKEAQNSDLEYFTFLFHDCYFNKKTFPEYQEFYFWFIKYCKERSIEFISYRAAINELENKL